jgi:hypothetical protein
MDINKACKKISEMTPLRMIGDETHLFPQMKSAPMPKRKQYGLSAHFGLGYDISLLPEGWKLSERADYWAIATDTEGQEYFVTQTQAIPRKKAERAIGRLSVGDYYADTDNPVELNPQSGDNVATTKDELINDGYELMSKWIVVSGGMGYSEKEKGAASAIKSMSSELKRLLERHTT